MSLAEYYNRVINWPGQVGINEEMAIAGALVLIAAVLLSFGRLRRFARGLGLIGVVLSMIVLWTVHEQTITRKHGPHITLIRYRYSQPVRIFARVALIGLPVGAGFVMSSVFMSTRRWLRAQVPSHLKLGRQHYVQKEYQAALLEYNKAIKTAPELAEGYCRRGSLYKAMGQTELALADFDRAIERDPRLAAAYLQRAKIRTESGDYDNALSDFTQLMNIKANDPESYLYRGICLVKKGLVHEAASDFQRVLKLTNHSDFAEPAKSYLRHCENQTHPPVPPVSANGSPSLPSSPQLKAHDLK